ncbi:hypothetical protein [Rickettsia canadensis]|uniref:Cell surface antigen-like protein Sca13 n=1 Tax=Rickettsia canadensis str. CA410 TaxID=1105107 RepID=A0ABM5MSI5_RICCA|nr:hypothetical protein [Rickettsia canadensis]AFB21513.1 cell surface antigen-like protein Sca13 [Rickettsia canadensis str. CA410]
MVIIRSLIWDRATPTSELIINVFYDTINADHTGNANSSNIVLASGGTI